MNADKIAEIRQDWKAGATLKEIQAKYSLSYLQTVAILVHGDQLPDEEVAARLPQVKSGMTGREVKQVMQ